ncbi:MAG: hypothetical protein ABR616_05745 [Dermatophilaceae bacterium]|nr:hypothetical protein [Intrasporangiaceae bacterium]
MPLFITYLTGNPGAIRKFFVALAAALAVLATVLADGSAPTTSEWIQVALAALGAVGVYAIPNAKDTTDSE